LIQLSDNKEISNCANLAAPIYNNGSGVGGGNGTDGAFSKDLEDAP
jgi:hypothetical protein